MKDSASYIRTPNVTIRQLRAFLAVTQEESMTGAARRLHLSPPALSMLISTLEGELKVRLFKRTIRRTSLTDAGLALLPSIRSIFDDLDSAFDSIRQLSVRRGARFSVATSPLLSATLLPILLSGFREKHPDIRVDLLDLSTQEIPNAVRTGQADLGIFTEGPDVHDLTTKVLYQDKLMFSCLSTHPLALQKEVQWSQLADEALILLLPGSGLRTLVDRGFSEAGEILNHPAFEVAQVMTAVGLVEAGLGTSVLPSYALTRTQASGIVAVPLVAPVIKRNIIAIADGNQEFPAPCMAFLTHFQREMVAPNAQLPALKKSGAIKKRSTSQ